MDLGGHVEGVQDRKPLLLDHDRRRREALVDGQVGALRVLDPPLVGVGAAAEGELEAGPVEDEADGTVHRVDRGNRADRDPVLLGSEGSILQADSRGHGRRGVRNAASEDPKPLSTIGRFHPRGLDPLSVRSHDGQEVALLGSARAGFEYHACDT